MTTINDWILEKEKDDIKNWAKKRKLTVSDLLREAIFTHLDFLDKNEGNLEKIELILLNQAKP